MSSQTDKVDETGETSEQAVANYLEWSDRGRAGIGRYVVGLVTVLVVFFLVGQVLSLPVAVALPDHEDSLIQSTIILLLGFVIPFFAIPKITQWFHHRPPWSVAMPWRSVRVGDFTVGFLASAVVSLVVLTICDMTGTIDLQWIGFDWSVWLPLLAIGIVGLAIQTASEEMLFRGYLAQFMRRLSKHPVVFIGVPALIFAAPHIANVESLGGGPWVLLPYFGTGLLYGWAAWRSGSLYMSWGLHFNNNLFNLLVVGVTEDILKSAAPLQFDVPGLTATSLIVLGQSALTFVVLAIVFRRRKPASTPPVSHRA